MILIIYFISLLLSTSVAFSAEDNNTSKKPLTQDNKTTNDNKTSHHDNASVKSKMPLNTTDFDIVLLIDSSGSMRKTDPNDYRKHAAKMFISLLGKNDRIAIVSFGDTAKVLKTLTINQGNGKNLLSNAVNKITSNESTTHINLGIREGLKLLNDSERQHRLILLLSDGKLTLGDEDKEKKAMDEITKMLEEAKKHGIKFYTIAFSKDSDFKLLDTIAKETYGFAKLAMIDKDLHIMFAEIFENIKGPDTIPIERDEFIIDSEIKEAIIIVSKTKNTNVVLVDPKNNRHTFKAHAKNMQWSQTKAFDMITISAPTAGTWKVNLSMPYGNKVYVLTNLTLQTSLHKNQFLKGDNISFAIWLERDKYQINEPDVVDKVQFKAQVISPDNKTIPLLLKKYSSTDNTTYGKYVASYQTNSIGEHKFTISAHSETFIRQKSMIVNVIKPNQTDNMSSKLDNKSKAISPKQGDGLEKTLINFAVINAAIIALIFLFLLIKKIVIIIKKKRTKNA